MWRIIELFFDAIGLFDLFRRNREERAENLNPEAAKDDVDIKKMNLELKSALRGDF